VQAMDDDFNAPQALAALFDLSREINRAQEDGKDAEGAKAAFRELTTVLGLTMAEPAAKGAEAAPFIELLIATRKDLRAAKQYALADALRQRLADLGVVLEDTPEGTRWKYQRG